MKKNFFGHLLFIALMSLVIAACKSAATNNMASSSSPSASPSATSNSDGAKNDSPPAGAASQSDTNSGGANSIAANKSITLVGTYAINEVQHNGVVSIIDSDNTTEISFLPDGTFIRKSKRGGRQDYSDSGSFRIDGKDELILTIIMSRGKMQNPPVEKRHTFSMSADGDELKLTGKDGKVAVFRRALNASGK